MPQEKKEFDPSTPLIEKNSKYYFGLICFWLSWPLWGAAFLVPFLEVSGSAKAMVAGGFLIVAEVLFYVSILFLGRPFLKLLTQRIKGLLAFRDT